MSERSPLDQAYQEIPRAWYEIDPKYYYRLNFAAMVGDMLFIMRWADQFLMKQLRSVQYFILLALLQIVYQLAEQWMQLIELYS